MLGGMVTFLEAENEEKLLSPILRCWRVAGVLSFKIMTDKLVAKLAIKQYNINVEVCMMKNEPY